ncbi:hypothetical protein HDK77DRAFT_86842 [Phyllosticta capitalensis]
MPRTGSASSGGSTRGKNSAALVPLFVVVGFIVVASFRNARQLDARARAQAWPAPWPQREQAGVALAYQSESSLLTEAMLEQLEGLRERPGRLRASTALLAGAAAAAGTLVLRQSQTGPSQESFWVVSFWVLERGDARTYPVLLVGGDGGLFGLEGGGVEVGAHGCCGGGGVCWMMVWSESVELVLKCGGVSGLMLSECGEFSQRYIGLSGRCAKVAGC